MQKLITIVLLLLAVNLVQAQSIGIGTATPHSSSLLDLTSTTKGFLTPRMTTTQRNAISNPTNGLMVYDTTTDGYWFYNGSSWVSLAAGGTSSWLTNGANIYFNGGNVGIGSSIPSEKLYIYNGQIKLNRTSAFDNSVLFNMPAAAVTGEHEGLKFSLAGTEKAFIGYTSTSLGTAGNYLRLSGADINANDLIINSSGNVGIGMNTPAAKLDVEGSVRARSNLLVDGISSLNIVSTTGNIYTKTLIANTSIEINEQNAILQLKSGSDEKGYFQISGDNVRLGTNSGNSNGNLIMRMNGTDRAILTNTGNFGMGTSVPQGRLHVAGRSYMNNGTGEALGIDGTNPFIQFYSGGTARFFMQQNGAHLTLAAATGNSTGRLILNGSQVTIGQITPATGYKLSIEGKAICTELKVQLQGSWPDYVFHNKYELMPLNELHQFIKTNNHLPNIPAAEELEKNGMEVGEMQRKMMEKIEELTLYIIDLQTQVDQLKKEKGEK